MRKQKSHYLSLFVISHLSMFSFLLQVWETQFFLKQSDIGIKWKTKFPLHKNVMQLKF